MTSLSDRLEKAMADFNKAFSETQKALSEIIEQDKKDSAEFWRKHEEMEKRLEDIEVKAKRLEWR